MAKEKIKYEEISKASISNAKNLVISYCSKGGFTLAQQMTAKDGNHEVSVFLKGAAHIKDIDALVRVRDAINIAIAEAEKRKNAEDEDIWDDEGEE